MTRVSVITELIVAGKQNLVICDHTCSMAYVYLFFITRCTCNTHTNRTLDKAIIHPPYLYCFEACAACWINLISFAEKGANLSNVTVICHCSDIKNPAASGMTLM